MISERKVLKPTGRAEVVKGDWRETITALPVLKTFTADELIGTTLSTNLIARPILNLVQGYRTIATLLTAPPGHKIADTLAAIKRGLEIRADFNRARADRIGSVVR